MVDDPYITSGALELKDPTSGPTAVAAEVISALLPEARARRSTLQAPCPSTRHGLAVSIDARPLGAFGTGQRRQLARPTSKLPSLEVGRVKSSAPGVLK